MYVWMYVYMYAIKNSCIYNKECNQVQNVIWGIKIKAHNLFNISQTEVENGTHWVHEDVRFV